VPRTVSAQRLFSDALGGARLRADRTITNTEAERALRAIANGADPAAQRAIVSAFLGSRAASQLSARAQETLRAFIANAGSAPTGDRALDVRGAAVKETREARARTRTAEARLDALLASPGASSAAHLKIAQAALSAARADVHDARALVLRIASARGARSAARALGLAATDLEKAAELLDAILGRAGGTRVKKADVEAVKRWLQAPSLQLQEAEAQLSRAPSGRGSGGYTTAKAPSDSEDQGASPSPGGPPPGGSLSNGTPRAAVERMRRALASLAAADDDEDDP
jgi:hypothetical protein